MGKYSVNGSPQFDALIDSHMEHITERVYSSTYAKHWRALVLAGGYGRGAGTPLIGSHGEELPFDDYHLALITRSRDPLIRHALQHMEARLSEELGVPVHLSPRLERSLRKSECSLLDYEMKRGHLVVRGDQNILSKLPDYSPDEIPLSEGTRLLLNGGKQLLDMKCRLRTGKQLTREEQQHFIKVIFSTNLAFGDCALLLRGAYDISYAVKRSRIDEIDLSGLRDAKSMAEAYHQAITFMERANFQPLATANLHVWFDETAGRFEDVFLWFERRRLNRTFRDPKKYAHTFPYLGEEGRPLKNIASNLRIFGPLAPSALAAHPRLRLYAAVLLLVTRSDERGESRWILRSNQSTFEGLCDRFISIYEKFC